MIPKIIWVQDYSTLTHPGGSQITSKYMVDWGINLGFDVKMVTKFHFEKCLWDQEDILAEGDWFILNNIVHFYNDYPGFIQKIVNGKRYMRYEHDYLWDHKMMEPTFIKTIFRNSKLNIFLSPLHRDTHQKWGINTANSALMPSPIDEKVFYDMGLKRNKNWVIYIGGIGNHKGINNIMEYARQHPELKFHLYGWVEHGELLENAPKNVEARPRVKFDEIPQLLNTYEYAIHMPNWNEPFGRAIMEAYFCGCKIINNEKIGAFSFDWDFSNPNEIRNKLNEEQIKFWQRVHNLTRAG